MLDAAHDPEEVLVGVLALRDRVEAHLVARTPFGRLRPGGRRAVEDDDDLGLAPGLGEGAAADPSGSAGATWAGCIAGAVEKLTFGLPSARVRVGVAVDGDVDVDRARVRGRGWCPDLAREVARVLATRGIELAEPADVAVRDLASAWAVGEAVSAVGLAGKGAPALVLVWGDAVEGFLVAPETAGGPTRVERLAPPAAPGSAESPAPLELGGPAGGAARVARALLSGPARSASRLVVTGPRVQELERGRTAMDLRLPFLAVLPPRLQLSDAPEASVDHPVWISRERGAPALGAAAAALEAAE